MSASSEALAADIHPIDLKGLAVILAPTLAGVAHAFTTRRGGVSPAPFDTLNLGRAVGDDPARVDANRERVVAALGRGLGGHVEASQVHGAHAARVGRADRGRKIAGADALVTDDPNVTLAIHCADCVPLLMYDPVRGAAGAVHAGWRGTARGVTQATVARMTEAFGTIAADLRVAIGPAIGSCHYEVDTPVAEAFARWPWRDAVLVQTGPDRWRLDLAAANRLTLGGLGVPDAQIWTAGACTACAPEHFFSYRRTRPTGRMGALIGL